jgi:Bacterial Ig-like domain
MKRRVLLAMLPVIALVVLAGEGDATSADPGAFGVTRGQPWTGSPGVTVSVADLAARQRAEDRRTAGQPEVIREKPEPGPVHSGSDALGEASGQAAVGTTPAGAGALDRSAGQSAVAPKSSFAANTSFLGAQLSESNFVPPDSMGSVGPTQVLVSVNGRIKVFDKQGNVGALNLDDSVFWSSVRNGAGTTDPGVEYDRLSGRWIVSAVNDASSNNRVMLAVSSGSTITDSSSFTFYQFAENTPPPAGDGGLFADYPQLGVDANAVYIGVNDFSGNTFAHSSAFVIRKSSLLGGGPIVVTAFRNLTSGGPGPDSPQPATDMDPNVNEGYIIGPDNQLTNTNLLDVRRVTNPGGTPSISGNLAITVPQTFQPLSVPAQGSGHNLDPVDNRLFEAMIGRGPDGTLSLWTAQNIKVNSLGTSTSVGDRDGARWYQLGALSTTPSVVQSGTLFDNAASNPSFFWIPSIAMNGQGHASLNTSVAGAAEHPEIAASGRLATDPANATETADITQTSTSSYNIGLQSGVLRWGDYSQTVVDPNDNQTFWTFQEYANATNSWGLRVIKMLAPPPATPSTATPSSVPAGQCSVAVDVSGTSTGGSGFFDPGSDPGGPGYTSHLTATVTGNVAVNGVTYNSPTVISLDLDTGSATLGPQDVTITNPDGQSVTATGLIDVVSSGAIPTPPCLNGTTPASPANDNSPRIFGSAEAGTTVNLYVDSGCTDPPVTSGSASNFAFPGIAVSVADDSTTHFYARATDGVNTSACSSTLTGPSASVTYVEDSTPPLVSVDSGPTGTTTDATPTFTFSGSDAVGPVGFQCSIDTGTPSFGACSGPGNSDTPASALADGSYAFRVRATDGAGNSAIATRSFTVQTASGGGAGSSGATTTTTPTAKPPPDTTFGTAPKKTRKRRPRFTFTASELGVSFRCKLDSRSFVSCTSPFRPPKLSLGSHVLRVEAVDPSGAADPSPAVRKFRVLPPA